jgi:ADP-heptose:LPS heptosyltransferase
MTLHRKQILDFYAGGLLILILRPIVALVGRLLRRDHELRVKGEICVQKLLGGGSLVLAYPALLGLRRRWPGARLSLVCTPAVVPFAESLRIFDRLLVIDDSGPLRLLWSAARAWSRCFRTDTLLDLEVYSRFSTVFAALTCARNRLGFFLAETFWRRGLHTHLVFFNRFSGVWFFYEKAVELLGAKPALPAECRAHLVAGLPARPPGETAETTCVGCNTSELAPERMLTAQQWRAVFTERAGESRGRRFVFLGTASDRALVDSICRELERTLPQHRYENRCGDLTLPESLAELAAAAEYWGVDSALLHYARLLGARCVSWWGPTDPRTRLRPLPGLEEDVVYRKIPCSPCVHVAERAPCGGNNLCIQNLFEPAGDEPAWPPYVD